MDILKIIGGIALILFGIWQARVQAKNLANGAPNMLGGVSGMLIVGIGCVIAGIILILQGI
ncbi:MAG: hypothetical protein ACHQHN_14925 [Sphingobacteriales bacterium]